MVENDHGNDARSIQPLDLVHVALQFDRDESSVGLAFSTFEFAAKHEIMIAQTQKKTGINAGLIKPPGYPFTARDLSEDLRSRLVGELGEEISFERLGQLTGLTKSTAHHWFAVSTQPQILALMCLLERLSSSERQAFVETHCRLLPSLQHPYLAHAPAKVGQMLELLRQENGLTLICGGSDFSRTFLVTALGHAYRRAGGELRPVLGIDLHRPTAFVPVESVSYIDVALNPKRLKELTSKLWPKILTASSRLVICNGLWTAAPELRQGILQCSKISHVLLAEAGTPDLRYLKSVVSTPLHVLTVSVAKRISGGIKIHWRHISTRKRLKNRASR